MRPAHRSAGALVFGKGFTVDTASRLGRQVDQQEDYKPSAQVLEAVGKAEALEVVPQKNRKKGHNFRSFILSTGILEL